MKQRLEEANRVLEDKLKHEELKGQIEVNSRKGIEVKILHEIRQKEEVIILWNIYQHVPLMQI